MALCAFPIIFMFGEGDEAKGFIYLALIAGVVAMMIHAVTLYTVREPSTSQGIDRVSGSLIDTAKSIGKNKPFWLVFSATLIVGVTTIFFGNNLVYFTKYALDLHQYQGTFLFSSGIISFASIAVWWFLSNIIVVMDEKLVFIKSIELSDDPLSIT